MKGITFKRIQAFTKKLVLKFKPEKVILFGSYVTHRISRHSDVDILVVMNTKLPTIKQEVLIRKAIPRDFPLDLIVVIPSYLNKRYEMGDPFIKTVIEKGKILYEKTNKRMD